MSVEGAMVASGASLLSAIFAVLVFRQFLGRRAPSHLAWSLGLAMYALASFMQLLAELNGWSATAYKVYYVTAASLVAVLGIGSVLFVHRRLGVAFAIYTAVVSVGFLAVTVPAEVDLAALATAIPTGAAMPSIVRTFSPMFTIPGSIGLIGVSGLSYWRTRRPFALWMGAGAAVVAAGGLLARYQVPWALYAAELIGIAMMFWGFLQSVEAPMARPSANASTAGR